MLLDSDPRNCYWSTQRISITVAVKACSTRRSMYHTNRTIFQTSTNVSLFLAAAATLKITLPPSLLISFAQNGAHNCVQIVPGKVQA